MAINSPLINIVFLRKTTNTTREALDLFVEMAEHVSLWTLPVEILCDIITLSDPVTLISLSQTSRQFRGIIQPSRHDFVQRLLALELTPEHGGIVPLFRSRDNHVEPAFEHPDWDGNKYACSGCLKLRSHKCFDNHAILSLKTRKPPLESPEACKPADWVPLELTTPGARWRRRPRLDAEEAARLAPFRQTYKWYCAGIYSAPWNLMPDDLDDIDSRGAEAEKMVCGLARHKRLCIECRRLRGDFAKQIARGQAPTIVSRPLRLPNEFSLYFPGLVEDIPVKRRPTFFKSFSMAMGRGDLTEETCFPRIVYCSSCGGWYNIAAFLIFEDRCWASKRYGDTFVDAEAECIMCLERKAKPGATSPSAMLAYEALGFLHRKKEQIADRLMFGWSRLHNDFFSDKGLLRKHAGWAHANLKSLRWAKGWEDDAADDNTARILDLFQQAGPKVLRGYYSQVRAYVQENVDPRTFEAMNHSWFRQWWNDYELNHREFVRMAGIQSRMEEDYDWVGYYALERAPWRIC